jgi:hypothetical protein
MIQATTGATLVVGGSCYEVLTRTKSQGQIRGVYVKQPWTKSGKSALLTQIILHFAPCAYQATMQEDCPAHPPAPRPS